jgi:hypothetical protein
VFSLQQTKKPKKTPQNKQTKNKKINATLGGDGGGVMVPAELLSLLGLTLGSPARPGSALFIETAFVQQSQLYALWPNGTCAKLGLAGAVNSTLSTLVASMVNASNTPPFAAAINAQLGGFLGGGGGGGGASGGGNGSSAAGEGAGGPLSLVASLRLNCTDVPTAYVPDAAALQRALYCGYRQARCDGGNSDDAGQYMGAYDWRATGRDRWGLSFFRPAAVWIFLLLVVVGCAP